MQALFVTGTDTGVGKTAAAAAIARALHAAGERVGALKPVCSGQRADGGWDDLDTLATAIGSDDLAAIGPLTFADPLSPPHAAQREGRTIDIAVLDAALDAWRDRCDWLVVEGAGGLLCPLAEADDGSLTIADLIVRWRMPVVTVADLRLGAINHSLLTAEGLTARGLAHRGWILNETTAVADPSADPLDAAMRENAAADIVRRSGDPLLARMPFAADRHAGATLRGPDGVRVDAATLRSWFAPLAR